VRGVEIGQGFDKLSLNGWGVFERKPLGLRKPFGLRKTVQAEPVEAPPNNLNRSG